MAASVNLKTTKAISNGALKSDALPSRIKILNWGVNQTLDGEVLFDEKSAKSFYANQRSIGRTLAPLDFNHNTVPGTNAYKADKEPRAIAAYGVPTVIPGDGLWYEYMTWTPSGQSSARDYADLSPTVLTDSENRVIGLHSCALTPAGSVENLSFFSADSMSSLMDMCAASNGGAKPNEVEYADAKSSRYPIDTEEHVRAAWSYIHMPLNAKEFTAEDLAEIKNKIAAKAVNYKIELRAESAGDRVVVDAYATEDKNNAKGIYKMLDENLEFFRKELGMGAEAKPEDVMAAARAKWVGLTAEKQVLPEATPGSSVDPNKRNGDMGGEKTPHGTISYAAEMKSMLAEALKPLSAELDILKVERNTKAQELETSQRDTIVSEAGRDGKVIPLSAEEIKQVPVAILRSIVNGLKKSEVPMAAEVLRPLSAENIRPLSADNKGPAPAGSRDRAALSTSAYFSEHGVKWSGRPALGTATRGVN